MLREDGVKIFRLNIQVDSKEMNTGNDMNRIMTFPFSHHVQHKKVLKKKIELHFVF